MPRGPGLNKGTHASFPDVIRQSCGRCREPEPDVVRGSPVAVGRFGPDPLFVNYLGAPGTGRAERKSASRPLPARFVLCPLRCVRGTLPLEGGSCFADARRPRARRARVTSPNLVLRHVLREHVVFLIL